MTQNPQPQPLSATSRPWFLWAAAIGYSIAWIVGLSVASSSTDVASSGEHIVRADAAHVNALALQFLLTEGIAALALLVVVIGVWRRTSGLLGAVGLLAGGGAVAISLSQTMLGLCLVEIAVREDHTAMAGALTVALNELDGAKMALLAVLAFAVAASRGRRRVRLPLWLVPTGFATAFALALSAIGYLTSNDALSVAAWVSLPLLLIYVTAVGLCVRPEFTTDPRHDPERRTPVHAAHQHPTQSTP